MANRRVHLRITGLVQGVSYRANTQELARRLGVSGWVRNLPGGEVESVAEGPPDALDRLIDWCKRGPRGARVDSVEVTEQRDDARLVGFEVRR
jgi:acylphosphatase